MKKDCTTCKYEPEWGPLQGRQKQYRQGFCKFGPLPPVYPKQEAAPVYMFGKGVGLPGACRAWTRKPKISLEFLENGDCEINYTGV